MTQNEIVTKIFCKITNVENIINGPNPSTNPSTVLRIFVERY